MKVVSAAELSTFLEMPDTKTEDLTEMLEAFRGFSEYPSLDEMASKIQLVRDQTSASIREAKRAQQQVSLHVQEAMNTENRLVDMLNYVWKGDEKLEQLHLQRRLEEVQGGLSAAQNQMLGLSKEIVKMNSLLNALDLAQNRLSSSKIVSLRIHEKLSESGGRCMLSCLSAAGDALVDDCCCDDLTLKDVKAMIAQVVRSDSLIFLVMPNGTILDGADHQLVKDFTQ
mmetsp:Transcript_53107/g.95270  ORF Transcript_53107/g.95270 Transcript_53107/m.95270 type:complete len:227 (-) Transcript_53107:123-803(-)